MRPGAARPFSLSCYTVALMQLERAKAWIDGPTRPWIWIIAATVSALLFGYLTCWVVFEYDVFWQIRAGAEILSGSGVQRVDRWSYTVNGQSWFNFQWLATVVDYLAFRLGRGYGALSWLRALLVGGWVFAIVQLIRRGAGDHRMGLLLAPVLVPWIYVACSFRLQMRPDLFAACCNAGLVTLWASDASTRSKRIVSLGLLLAWTNFHSGTYPFGLLFFCLAVFFDRDLEPYWKKCLWMAAGTVVWLATPLGWHFVHPFFGTLLSHDWSAFGNPDNQPFDFSLLESRRGGYSLQLWVAYSALALICVVGSPQRTSLLPGIYQNRGFVLAMGSLLTVAVFWRIRAIHYQMLFLVPVVTASIRSFVVSTTNRARGVIATMALGATVVLWSVVLPGQVRSVSKPLGAHVYDQMIPVQSVAFLKANRPQGHLLGDYQFGGYLIGELPEYPVALDGREVPFREFIAKWREAGTQPESNAAFLRHYDVNALILNPPSMIFDPMRGFGDTHIVLYPPQEWAQVFFDNASVVYLRRIPQNQAIIEKHEYKSLRRGLPANFGASYAGIPDVGRAMFEVEIDRCLAENPRCVYCLVAKSAFHRLHNDANAALTLLTQALVNDPSSVDALIEISGAYESLGRLREAADAKRRFQELAGVPES